MRGLIDWLRKGPEETLPPATGAQVAAPRPPGVPKGPPKTDLMQRFEDRGQVGRGGMSSVRRVLDTNLLRELAMKVLDPELARDELSRQGFVEEAQITAQLDHPNIVPVHEFGVDAQGTQYLAMKLVQGHTLTRALADFGSPPGSPDSLREHLDIVLKVCDAVAFAHNKGVLHCDLKPDNIMVGGFGEVYVMDWGLARVMQSDKDARRSVVAVSRPPGTDSRREGVEGTPAFMSPEQAWGNVDHIDERTDVFCMGAVIYYLATGKPPFDAATARAGLDRARKFDFVPPESWAQKSGVTLPPAIGHIIKKAMAPKREDRYATIYDLKRDVQRFLQGGLHFPTRTYPAGARIVVEGDPGDCAYIINRGRCVVYKGDGPTREVMRELGPGSVFGETAVIANKPRTATVETLEEVSVTLIDNQTLLDGLGMDSWIGPFVHALAERFRDVDHKLSALRRTLMSD